MVVIREGISCVCTRLWWVEAKKFTTFAPCEGKIAPPAAVEHASRVYQTRQVGHTFLSANTASPIFDVLQTAEHPQQKSVLSRSLILGCDGHVGPYESLAYSATRMVWYRNAQYRTSSDSMARL